MLRALVSMNLESGNNDAARTYARQLQRLRPGDLQVNEVLRQLGDG